MKVFVTGAHGFVGAAVVSELQAKGHTVIGLAHHDKAAAILQSANVEVHRGSIDDTGSLKAGVAKADGAIHLAFKHDFTKFAQGAAADVAAVNALGSAVEGTGKPLVVPSSFIWPASTKDGVKVEDLEIDPSSAFAPRGNSDLAVWALVEKGVKTALVRLPPAVHGHADEGFIPGIIAAARKAGYAGYVGEGANHWPGVHRVDAARLFAAALEGLASGHLSTGRTLHAVGDRGIPTRLIAETIAKGLGISAKSYTKEEATEQIGVIGPVWTMDTVVSIKLTTEWTGWEPKEVGLLEDISSGDYLDNNKTGTKFGV